MVPLKAKSQRVSSEGPGILRGSFKSILKQAGISEVTGRADKNTLGGIGIGCVDGYPGHLRESEDVGSVVGVGVAIFGVRKGPFPDETEPLGPHGVGRYGGGVLQRESL